MGFQWNRKDTANRAKHSIGFEQARAIFDGIRIVRDDRRREYGERCFLALGLLDAELISVVYATSIARATTRAAQRRPEALVEAKEKAR